MDRIETNFTRLVSVRYPIVGAPMFLVSTPRLVAAVSNAGALGTMPSLNFRESGSLKAALASIRALTPLPFGINLIVNKSNPYREQHARICLDAGVPVFITSLGNPKEVIRDAHASGAMVFCDVIELAYALRVRDLGADGVVAVAAGAGGHAGRVVPQVLIPYLKERLGIPILAAGGIADGRGMVAALALGADAAYVGTRFIASEEAEVSDSYKHAVLDAQPEDVVYTARVTGTHANFIRTPYIERLGVELRGYERFLFRNRLTKRWFKGFRMMRAGRAMAKSADAGPSKAWRDIWSAGQSAALVREILPAARIVSDMVAEYGSALDGLPRPHGS